MASLNCRICSVRLQATSNRTQVKLEISHAVSVKLSKKLGLLRTNKIREVCHNYIIFIFIIIAWRRRTFPFFSTSLDHVSTFRDATKLNQPSLLTSWTLLNVQSQFLSWITPNEYVQRDSDFVFYWPIFNLILHDPWFKAVNWHMMLFLLLISG